MARDFDGTDDVLDMGDQTVLDLDGTNITLAVWINLDENTSNKHVVNKWGGAPDQLYLLGAEGNPNKVKLVFHDGTGFQQKAGATTIGTGAWHHIAATYDGSNIRVYLDGSEDGSAAVTTSIRTGTVSFRIGGSNEASRFVDGQLAEGAAWNIALTAGELATLGNKFSPLLVRPQNLAGYWPIIGRTSPEIDLINGNDGTVTGATVFAHPPMIYPTQPISGFAAAGAPPAGLIIPVAMHEYRQRHQSVV